MIQKDKLIAQINAKDIKGFRTLYEQVYPMLVSYVSEIILSDEAAENIVQDLFVYIWESDVTFPSFSAFRSYLYTYVRNTALDYLKHQHIEQDYVEKPCDFDPFGQTGLSPFGYNMIDPLKSWCWGSILFYPFKISRFS